MQNLPNPGELVLVAVMPQPKDMEIARVLGWYRVPLRSAPKVISVDWLAFYQPASFGDDHKWCIEWAAPVRGHELTTRAELFKDQRDHPHAGEEYFKIQLGPLVSLPTPVQAGSWKRVTFLYTTGERLLNSALVNELTVHDEERVVLWQALRERAMQAQGYQVQDLPELPLSPDILALFGMLSGSGDRDEKN